jgi:hypothetical protein
MTFSIMVIDKITSMEAKKASAFEEAPAYIKRAMSLLNTDCRSFSRP